MDSKPRPRHRLLEELAAKRKRHRQRSWIVRVLFMLAGSTLVLTGAAMLVLPGPALVVLPVGFAILALEFAWAERMLEQVIEQAEKAKKTAGKTTRLQRIVLALAAVAAVCAVLAAELAWDLPLIPLT